jgi:polyhydroxyalkanoate synthesis repressor PhaR
VGAVTVALQDRTRLIRKYPNRRLYDTEESRYITFADIRDLVLQGVDFKVIDKKNGDDLTRCILLQVICEQEQNGKAVLSERFLSQVIRAYGHPASSLLVDGLEDSVELFLGQQGNFSQEIRDSGINSLSQKIP